MTNKKTMPETEEDAKPLKFKVMFVVEDIEVDPQEYEDGCEEFGGNAYLAQIALQILIEADENDDLLLNVHSVEQVNES